jgi:hypothetical protein
MTANEANGTDGQQRLMLEVTYETLENAGVPMHSILGSKTGVYVGCFTKDFESLGGRDPFAAHSMQPQVMVSLCWPIACLGSSTFVDQVSPSTLLVLPVFTLFTWHVSH